ncbi:MAG: hypothetical protein MI724_14815 [Spirochaetales bacterium]|nr:hypothetical protein [Spirochaetales bacterium]
MSARRPVSRRWADAAALLVALALQTVVVAVDAPQLTGGFLLVVAATAIAVRSPLRKVRRAVAAILVILIPVLFLRLLASPSWTTVVDWSIYLARLLSAVLIAVLYLHLRTAAGLRRALHTVLKPLPGTLRGAVTDMIASTFHLTPILTRRLADSQGALRVRMRRKSRLRPWRPYTVLVRSFLISVATLPRARAEAMVTRGLVGRPTHTESHDETT